MKIYFKLVVLKGLIGFCYPPESLCLFTKVKRFDDGPYSTRAEATKVTLEQLDFKLIINKQHETSDNLQLSVCLVESSVII